MATPEITDLAAIDRDVSRAFAAWRRWKRDLARDPATHADDDPLGRWRHVAGRATYESLRALKPPASEVPLRDALARWIHALTQARLAQPIDAELAAAAADKSARARLPKPHLASWNEAWGALLEAKTEAERCAWIDAATERGPALSSIAHRRAERRHEAARRLGLEHPGALFPIPPATLAFAAESLLDRTEDLSRAILREARLRAELAIDPPLAVDAVAVALAREGAGEGWPARLSLRWLDATFGAFARGLRLDVPPLPAPIGASSFARACGSFGAALRIAGASPSLPFALARDPEFAAMHRFACVFGALPASPAFQKRVLGNGARIAGTQARVLARTALLQVRLEAARFLLGGGTSVDGDRFQELTSRVLGAPLPRALAGAWPAQHDDAAARFTGLLTARDLSASLVDRFDVDWFANPRAVVHLRALASPPALEEAPAELATLVPPLARAFEEALG